MNLGVWIIAQCVQWHRWAVELMLTEMKQGLKEQKKPGRYTPPKKKRK